MDKRMILLVLLGVSLLISGCAGKGAPARDVSAPDGDGGAPAQNDASGDDKEVSQADKDLADLFIIDADKPLEGEGFDVKSPEAQNGS